MVALLAYRTWRTIRLASLAHGLKFDTTQTKQQGYERLRSALIDGGQLRRAYQRLTDAEREPLIALQMAGGSLRQHEFEAQFGAIRRYRPWRADAPRHPWRRPVSVAEKLWQLALVEIVPDHRHDRVVLVDEVRSLLPPLPRPQPVPDAHPTAPTLNPRAVFCRDLAAFLAALLAGEGCWVHQRWLSPRSLVAINRRMLIPERTARSELRTGRTRFLHYAAHATRLIAPQLPTPAAWQWLASDQRWQTIAQAITRDLHSRHPLWEQYRLPPISAAGWDALLTALAQVPPDQPHTVESLIALLRFTLSRKLLTALLDGVLTWLGLVVVDGDAFTVTAPEVECAQPARLVRHENAFYVDLPPLPDLRAFVEVSSWAALTGQASLRIDAAAMRRAVEQGYDAAQIVASLAALIGVPLDRRDADQVRSWVKAAHRLTLRPLLVLTATDPATLRAIRADWRLRPLLENAISPHHLVVQAGRSDELCRRLARRGHAVTRAERSADPPTPAAAEYLYLAARVYQQLGGIAPAEVHLPGEVARQAAAALDPAQIDALDQTAAAYVDKLRQMLTGRIVGQGGVAQDDPEGIRAALQIACEQRSSVTIVYFSPAHGAETTRTIEPNLLYERNGAAYVEAWCRLDGDVRTFRVDRIVRIVDPALPRHRRSGSWQSG